MADQLGAASQVGTDSDGWDEDDFDTDLIAKELEGVDLDFLYDAEEAYAEASHILISKHKDYGPLNISNSPGGPLTGLAVRLHDKVARLNNLIGREDKIKHESLHDTFLDIANYGIIGMMVTDGKWPIEEGEQL